MKNIGWSVIAPYFVVFYAVPLIMMAFLGPHLNFINNGNILLLLAVLIWVFIVSLVFSRINISFPVYILSRFPSVFESGFFLIAIGVLVFPLAIKFQSDFGISFRHSSQALSEAGFLPQFITLYKSFFVGLVTYGFILVLRRIELSMFLRLGLGVHTLNWTLCANGAVDVLWVFLGFTLAIKGSGAGKLLLTNMGEKGYFKVFFVLLISGFAVFGIIFFGYVNKVGFDAAYEIFANEFASRVIYYLYYRLVVFVSSLDMILERGLDVQTNLLAVKLEYDVFMYRLGIIFDFFYAKPEVKGINQLNYLTLYRYPANETSGASPGPIASFGYMPFLPINFVLAGFYIALIRNTCRKVFSIPNDTIPTFFSMLIFILIGFVFFHNPISAFTKVGPEIFKTVFFIYVFAMAIKKSRVIANLPAERAAYLGK